VACHQIIGAKLDAGAFGSRTIEVLFASGYSVPPEATHDDRGRPGHRSRLDIIKGMRERITTDDHMGYVMVEVVEPPPGAERPAANGTGVWSGVRVTASPCRRW
jgi:hypothetical protein